MNRKELENILSSLKPAGLSERTLARLEDAVCGQDDLDASLRQFEALLVAQQPRALDETAMARFHAIVADVPFALNDKVLMFPGSRKDAVAPPPAKRWRANRFLATAAVAAIGGLAAFLIPVNQTVQPVVSSSGSGELPPLPAKTMSPGIVTTSYGSGIQKAADEGVIWTQNRQPKRVLRFRYQDRVLVRDENGIERMLFIPREELLIVPEKIH
ncbi:MAG: hypothetical protein KGQ89_07690 [Verrucomicrobia bacterium]|nr:hypothetical protein [Verrucomicrobiota bacterium]